MKQPEVALPAEVADFKKLQAHFRPQVIVLVLLKSSYFLAQIACFWLFSAVMHQLIVAQQHVVESHFYWFGASASCWVLLRHTAQNYEISFDFKIKQALETRIHQQLAIQQTALANQYSTFHWQQVFLQHIPAVSAYLSQYLGQKYLSALIPLFALVMVFFENWLVATILLVSLPLVPVFMILVGHRAASIHRKHLVSLERLGGIFVDRLKALSTITTFNQHKKQSQLLHSASKLVNQQTMKVVSVAFLSTTVLDFFATISIALVAVYIGFSLLGELLIGPSITLQQGLFLLLLAPLLFSELKNLGRLYHQKAEAEAAWESLFPLVKYLPELHKKGEFRGINWLSFKVEKPMVFAPILHLMPGQRVHLQGPSGAGKSSFLHALMGFVESSHCLSGSSVLLGQSPVVLPVSVRDNLSVGHSYKDDVLWTALQKVQLDKVIKAMPQGLETKLGEHPPLSGGELQRLMLARVLLQPADVILLDEPTAHLPEAQHVELSKLIYELTKGKTVIWASHKVLPSAWFDLDWRISDGVIETYKTTAGVKDNA